MSLNTELTKLIGDAERHLASRSYEAAHGACLAVLKRDPNSHSAYYLLGVLTAEHDNHARAVELFERAIALAPGKSRYHAWKGRSLIALNQRREAVSAAEAAMDCGERRAQTNDTIGVIFSRAGLHGRAEDFYQLATQQAPDRADYWYNLGAARQFQGKFEDAKAAFRQALEIAPTFFKAWSSLVQMSKSRECHDDIASLEDLFETQTEPEPRLYVGHALAKVYEDEGDIDSAMTWLARAKAGKKAEIGYTVSQDRPLFAAAARTSIIGPAEGNPDRSPIFIVGLPRSGTTLIDRILSSHPDVESAGELTDFALELKRAAGTKSRYVLDAETLTTAARLDLAAVGRAYVQSARRIVPNARRFIDKMPLNFFNMAIIQRALPHARIICVRRHPADSVLSNYRQLFATEYSYYNYAFDLADTAEYFVEFDSLVSTFREQLDPGRFTEVAYEDVVGDIETEARRLIAFCGLTWNPACLAFHENSSPVATASSAQVRRPLYSSSVGRWKSYKEHIGPALEVLRERSLIS